MTLASPPKKSGGLGDWLLSRTGLATAVAVAVLAFLVATGHRAHLLGVLPYLLLLACPLIHIFMHGGHGSHGAHDDGHRNKPAQE